MLVRSVTTILASACSIAVASTAGAQKPTDTARCSSGRWLPARALRTHEGYTIMAPRASVLPLNRNTLFTAWPILTYDSTGKLVFPLAPDHAKATGPEQVAMAAIADSDGEARLLPSPRGLLGFPLYHEASASDAGVVHALFGSDDSMPATSLISVRSVWYTRMEGEGWAVPERILTSENRALFSPSYRSPIVARSGVLHAMVGMEAEGLRYLRRSTDVWTLRHVGIQRDLMGYPSIAVLSTGRVVLIVQAGVLHPLTSSMSSVDVTWSDDDGVSWTVPRRISDPAAEPVYDLHLFADEQDALYAFWYQATDPDGTPTLRPMFGAAPGRVQAAESTDGGETWRHFPPSVLLPNAGELRLLLLPDHTALAALANARDDQIITMSWSGRWSTPELTSAGPQPFNPSLGLGGAQRPVLVWGITHRPDWTTTMMTTYVPCR